MILSRTLARRRIAAGERPGLLAAWGPVGVDFLTTLAVLGLFGGWVMQRLAAAEAAAWTVPASLVLTVFVPMQAVVILSTIWAVKSRWRDDDGRGSVGS